MTSDLRERVARAMYERWQSTRPNAPPFDNLYLSSRESELADADAAIALVLEEAARVVEFSPDSHTAREMQLMLDKAAAIRALATQP